MDGGVQQHVTRKTAPAAKKGAVKPDANKPRVKDSDMKGLGTTPPALVRQKAQPGGAALKMEPPKMARKGLDSDAVGRGTDHGVAKMNSMIPKPSPRTQSAKKDSPLKNSGRSGGNKALDTIGKHAVKRLETAIGAGRGDAHKASTQKMHEERAFIYDQTKAGFFGKAQNKMVDKALGLGGAMGISAADDKKEKRTQMILEAKKLKPYQKRIKEKNAEAAKREKIASTLKKTKKGAKYADYVGTGVSFVAPHVGAGIKLGAKATKIAAGAGATLAYETARRGYKKNVDDSATGNAMFDSHVSKEKADMMRNTRNKMAVSTGASIIGSVGSFAVEAAAEDLSHKAATAIQGGYDIGKRVAKEQLKKPFKQRILENKSELVNLMQHQQSREARKKVTVGLEAAIANRQMANMANKKK